MTKAELQAENDQLRKDLETLRRVLEERPLDTWIAGSDTGSPVCVPFKDDCHGTHFYRDDEGDVIGVIVSQDSETLLAAGLIPGEVVMEELKWLRSAS